MARKLYYKILEDGHSRVTDEEWDAISRLQHWYNSEFIWTAGRLGFKMYAIFPNLDCYFGDEEEFWQHVVRRRNDMRNSGFTENETVRQMESEGIIVARKGGYLDHCLASGFTRVAANEWNAYLVCEFLLKASTIARNAIISVTDEGKFIKTGRVVLRNASVVLPREVIASNKETGELLRTGRIFAVVDAEKYNRHPSFRNIIPGFNKLKASERKKLVRNWNWLGYEGNFDADGDDLKGFDLNAKVRSVGLEGEDGKT